MAGGKGGGHARRPDRLDADDVCSRCAGFHPEGDAGGEPTSADGNDHAGQALPELTGQLEAHGALPSDDPGIVEGMDVDGTPVGGVGDRGGSGLVIGAPADHWFDPRSTDGPDALPLLSRGRGREEDAPMDAESGAAEGHPLGVVAGTGADDPG